MEIFIYSLIPKCITALEDDLDILGKRFKFECQFEKIKIDQSRLAMMYDKKMYSFFFFFESFPSRSSYDPGRSSRPGW